MAHREFIVIWRFVVRRGCVRQFARVYGPAGRWAQLFRQGTGYRGTELFRDRSRPRTFLTIDRWTSATAYRAFRKSFSEAYAEIDRANEHLTESEDRLSEAESSFASRNRA